jgi:hypothetical protein
MGEKECEHASAGRVVVYNGVITGDNGYFGYKFVINIYLGMKFVMNLRGFIWFYFIFLNFLIG